MIISLPVCRHRGAELLNGRYQCSSLKLIVSPEGINGEICLICPYVDHPHTEGTQKTNQRFLTAPCIYRLPLLREEECPSCYGMVKLKVFGCEKHGQCTIGKKLDGMACCAECPDYKALVQ